jgi:ribosomal protein S28E/S33
LGAWTAAEFTKRVLEEYSLDMPVCAIDVSGDEWNIYLVYARIIDARAKGSFTTQFVGPIKMGDTMSLRGCFALLTFLAGVADWGLGAYRQWFEREILDLYRPKNHAGE